MWICSYARCGGSNIILIDGEDQLERPNNVEKSFLPSSRTGNGLR